VVVVFFAPCARALSAEKLGVAAMRKILRRKHAETKLLQEAVAFLARFKARACSANEFASALPQFILSKRKLREIDAALASLKKLKMSQNSVTARVREARRPPGKACAPVAATSRGERGSKIQ